MTAVLVDGYALSDGSGRRGIGTFLKRLLAGLSVEPEISVSVLAEPTVRLPAGAELVPLRKRSPRRFGSLAHDLWLPTELTRRYCDVFLSPAQHPPRRAPVPWVQTLHDVTPLTRPHPMLARDRRRWKRIGPRLRRANAIVAVSHFSASEGIRHLGLDPNVVSVIPLGVDTHIFNPDGAVAGSHPYLLHVAAWGPNKGFTEALGVIAELAGAGLPHKLVLAGPHDDWMSSQVQAAVAASSRADRVEVAGYVDDLPSLYRGATALLMTSRCEGFGLPALEAMACGTPVVAFANSSLPEVLGEAGVLVADGDLVAMVSAVRRLIGDPGERNGLSEAGVERAAAFGWEHMVRSYGELLRSVST